LPAVYKDNQLLAVYGDCRHMEDGRHFWSADEDPLQWAAYNLAQGIKIQPHVHKKRNRQFACKTTEMFVVLAGKLRANIYDLNRASAAVLMIEAGGWLCCYDGGHGFEIMENGTKFLEVKLGPFVGVDEDKERF